MKIFSKSRHRQGKQQTCPFHEYSQAIATNRRQTKACIPNVPLIFQKKLMIKRKV
jgi:hypothetical protein